MVIPLSIIIKTFERPNSLINLLKSIKKTGIKYPILIADDSFTSNENLIVSMFPDLPITYINLPFDTGLSEGRNALLNSLETPFFVLCDDDYVFEERTDLKMAYEAITKYNLDIIGGAYFNFVSIPNIKIFIRQLLHPFRLKRFFLNQYLTSRYIGIFKIKDHNCELEITNKPAFDSSIFLCDLVNNFFLAKTDAIKSMGGWDKSLKMGEHEDFFLRAKQSGIKVAFLNGFGIQHYPAIPVKNSSYNQYRIRATSYKKKFAEKHGFKTYTERQIDSGKTLFHVAINQTNS